jgi:dinuclear metal center YbgI/SA1388 family protein
MVSLKVLTNYLDELLDINAILKDKSNNGLQVEGKGDVGKVVGCVDACLELYGKAAAGSADFLFVHHGESWGEGIRYFTGLTGRRFEMLFRNGISLYAAHLPLDAHRILGHNARIASLLELKDTGWFANFADVELGIYGDLAVSQTSTVLMAELDEKLSTTSSVLDFSGKKIKRVGIVSGGGADAIRECNRLNIDCLVTGECDHTHYHIAKELNIILITSGHYKTEVPGILAVLDRINEKFDVDCDFIDIPTGL